MDCVMIDRVQFELLKSECDSLRSRNIALEQENATVKNEMQLMRKLCQALEHIKFNLEKTLEMIRLQFNVSQNTQFSFERDMIEWQEEYTNIKMMLAANQLDYSDGIEEAGSKPFTANEEKTMVTCDSINEMHGMNESDQIGMIRDNDSIQVEYQEVDNSIEPWEQDQQKTQISVDTTHDLDDCSQIEFEDIQEHQFAEVHVEEENGAIIIRPVEPDDGQKKTRRTRKSFLADKMIVSVIPGTKRFNCTWENCTYATNSSGNFQKHYRIHTGEKPYKCDFEGCGYSCSDPGSIKEHRRIHSTEKEFACGWPGCTWKFTTFKLLKNHVKACHTGEKPHKCDWPGCEKSFLAPYALRTHKLKHTGDRPFKCDIGDCPKAFTRSNDLLRHKRETHCTEKKFGCDYESCNAKFYRKDDLRHHVKRKHESPVLANRERKKKCVKNLNAEAESGNQKPNKSGKTRKQIKQEEDNEFDEGNKVVIDLNLGMLELKKGNLGRR